MSTKEVQKERKSNDCNKLWKHFCFNCCAMCHSQAVVCVPVIPQQQFDKQPSQGSLNVSETETPKQSFDKQPPPGQLRVSKKNTLKPPLAKRSPPFVSEINTLQNLSLCECCAYGSQVYGAANWISVPRIGFCTREKKL
jgi:hypothetical protein